MAGAEGMTRMLWLQGASCGGCTMSILESGASGWFDELRQSGIDLIWHPSVSEETGDEVVELLDAIRDGRERLDLLVLEGSVARGPNLSGRFNMLAGTNRSIYHWLLDLAPLADYVIAVGSCAAYGGIPAAGINPTDAVGLQFEGSDGGGALGTGFRSKRGLPVINIAGCAPHPGWVMESLLALTSGDLTSGGLDAVGRPTFIANHLAHHGCSRNEFYEFKASAETMSERGCLMEHLGCRATQAVGDCNQRSWNGGGSCTKGGYACIACTSPGFETAQNYLQTAKLAGIPVGLPTDMPKAWFVALAALSKSATPRRVRVNATADHVVVPPSRSGDKRSS
ncbi:uptake hydrogenase accessory protein HupU [Bradyrhizobium sp. ORS 285]|uniref:NADH-quinone oxidoreductase subunit B family protein n=1 Tax=Bradyrhizobium sp. ORS 285 TaxID=115808 RepID=UPI0002405702|nr:uptake hydrogenase accessory protein HupU [Bradyrhizobium sp. ORS 285]CCD88840.1 uptake hydrogenase accessory protein HupU [Bradyrhizobium sp. ORS 285]SMX56743.1 uptake hydrogenase accessory protein HupU [Bradyrhizobium sp. ORS 285]